MNVIAKIASFDALLTRAEVAGIVALAARTVPPLWPLESAIAVNPLSGFEELPYADAVKRAAKLFGARETLPLTTWRALFKAGRIDEQALRDAAIRQLGGAYAALGSVAPGINKLDLLMARLLELAPLAAPEPSASLPADAAFIAKWCGAFFDQGIAASAMPFRELGLYRAVLALAEHDTEFLALTGHAGEQLLHSVPRDPLEAIAEGLAATSPDASELDHLAMLVARLPGWAGHIRWRNEYADAQFVAGAPATMADLLALWLMLERAGALVPAATPPARSDAAGTALAAHFALDRAALSEAQAARFQSVASMDEATLGNLFMTAAEWSYANDLVPRLERAAAQGFKDTAPDAQLVFCIDVRSEGFRYQLERLGNYDTFGYAGFFGLPIALQPLGDDRRQRRLPVLLSPQHEVAEIAVPGKDAAARSVAERHRRSSYGAQLFGAAKLGTSTAFATAEATGPLAGLAMIVRTLAPRAVARFEASRRSRREQALQPAVEQHGNCAPQAGFTLAEKIGYAAALFRLTGLQPNTARLVVLAGHGGSAVNNPYAAALDCGACGGHAGGVNARLLAAMLNDPAVRAGLAREQIVLPETTLFLAAEHDTTTDAFTLYDLDRVPASHRADIAALRSDLDKAAVANRARRAASLGQTPDSLMTGAVHWGEVRPEWGLAGNASFIVGPRWLTRQLDLEGRAFLHSYDWRSDGDGTALATILTAPMVVAQWINCQYLFSTLDNERYGSGDKVTQNVIGGIGVVQGNGGDLRVGLPRQSLFTDAGQPYHVPQRLLAIVHAPLERVERVVSANDILGRLFGKGWVQLVVIDPATGKALRWREDNSDPAEGVALHSLTA